MQAPSGKERGCLWHLSQGIAGVGGGEARRTGRKSKVLQDATSSVPMILLMTTGSRKWHTTSPGCDFLCILPPTSPTLTLSFTLFTHRKIKIKKFLWQYGYFLPWQTHQIIWNPRVQVQWIWLMVSKAEVKSVTTSLDGKSGETGMWELRIDTGVPLTPISQPAGWDDVTDPCQPPVLLS